MLVPAWLERAAWARPGTLALDGPEGSLTYDRLLSGARAAAATLEERGAGAGERVAIALPAGLDFVVAVHATLLCGAIAVPVDLRMTAAERRRAGEGAGAVVEEPLWDAGAAGPRGSQPPQPPAPAGAVAAADRPDAAARPDAPAGPEPDAPAGPGPDAPAEQVRDGARRCEASSERMPAGATSHDLGATAAVIHTSGTTARAAPVELTYGNLLWSALGSAVAIGLDREERWLCPMPMAHVGGFSVPVRSAIYGTTAVVHARFQLERVLHALHHERITVVSLVPTTLARLLDAGLEHPPSLRCVLLGGAPIPPELVRRAHRAGVPVSATYGLTQAASQVATRPLAAAGQGPGRGARPLFCTRLRIAPAGLPQDDPGPSSAPDDLAGATQVAASASAALPSANGRAAGVSGALGGAGEQLPAEAHEAGELPPSVAPEHGGATGEGSGRGPGATIGEIEVAGPTVAPGCLEPDGWLRTGDLGYLDADGCLHVCGRISETIISGGENVMPGEVEEVLESHPEVLEAAVIGRPHPQWGEAVTAVVVGKAGGRLRLEALRAHCAARLAPYKLPRELELIAGPLPRTRSGKLLRRELR